MKKTYVTYVKPTTPKWVNFLLDALCIAATIMLGWSFLVILFSFGGTP